MAAISALDIIKRALREIRVLGVGQPVSSNDEANAFARLNNILEAISLSDNKLYADTEEEQTLTAGQARYTVGSGGDFNTNRPLSLSNDIFIRTTGNSDYPVRLLTQDVYRFEKTKETTGRPRIMTYTPEFPLGKISLYPTPGDSTDVLHYRANVLLEQFATVTTTINFPPGYELGIITRLAIAMAPQKGKTVSAELAATHTDTWELIESKNASLNENQPARLDELAVLVGRRRTGNILTGTY